MYNFKSILFVFNLLATWAHADEAAAMCAFVTATNINSIKSDWSCGNTDNRCSWNGVTCQDGNITEINIQNFGVSGKSYIKITY